MSTAETEQRENLGDEKTAEEREAEQAKRHEEAKAALRGPMGGEPVSRFRVQITGGAIELPASAARVFVRDGQVECTIRGWVKTGKETTEQKGGAAAREMVVVLEEITGYEQVPDAQTSLAD